MGEMSPFIRWWGVGERDEHKVDQKIVMIRSTVLWEGFFHSVKSSFDL